MKRMNKLIYILFFTVMLISCNSFQNDNYLKNTIKIYTELVREKNIKILNIKPKYVNEYSFNDKKLTTIFTKNSLLNGLEESQTIDQSRITEFWKKTTKIMSQDSIEAFDSLNHELTERNAFYEISNPLFDSKKQYAIIEIRCLEEERDFKRINMVNFKNVLNMLLKNYYSEGLTKNFTSEL
jgi:hypothetical protein